MVIQDPKPDQQFLKSNQPVWHQQPCHSHGDHIFLHSDAWCEHELTKALYLLIFFFLHCAACSLSWIEIKRKLLSRGVRVCYTSCNITAIWFYYYLTANYWLLFNSKLSFFRLFKYYTQIYINFDQAWNWSFRYTKDETVGGIRACSQCFCDQDLPLQFQSFTDKRVITQCQ